MWVFLIRLFLEKRCQINCWFGQIESGVIVKSGINIAEAVRKNALFAALEQQNENRDKICFFISHKEEDVDAAIALGEHIMNDFGYNIYLDIFDRRLQEADRMGNVDGVSDAIHDGIVFASHLLCIISAKSKDSWWIPYEIGFAKAKGVKVSSIKIKQNEFLPSYLRVSDSPVFESISELDAYLEKNGPYGTLFSVPNLGLNVEQCYLYFEK